MLEHDSFTRKKCHIKLIDIRNIAHEEKRLKQEQYDELNSFHY